MNWDDKKYLDWVRQRRCVVCRTDQNIEAHHIIGVPATSNADGHITGRMGSKNPDATAMPVCRPCHGHIHTMPMVYQQQYQWALETLVSFIEESKRG